MNSLQRQLHHFYRPNQMLEEVALLFLRPLGCPATIKNDRSDN